MKSSKLTKRDLKGIVKECLIEILAEGLVGNGRPTQLKEQLSTKNLGRNKKNSYLESIKNDLTEADNSKKANPNFSKNINSIVNGITDDPILNEVLRDTAATTLQNQNNAESKRGASMVSEVAGDKAQKIVSRSEPEELFGAETSEKWAALAFSD